MRLEMVLLVEMMMDLTLRGRRGGGGGRYGRARGATVETRRRGGRIVTGLIDLHASDFARGRRGRCPEGGGLAGAPRRRSLQGARRGVREVRGNVLVPCGGLQHQRGRPDARDGVIRVRRGRRLGRARFVQRFRNGGRRERGFLLLLRGDDNVPRLLHDFGDEQVLAEVHASSTLLRFGDLPHGGPEHGFQSLGSDVIIECPFEGESKGRREHDKAEEKPEKAQEVNREEDGTPRAQAESESDLLPVSEKLQMSVRLPDMEI